MERRLPRGRTGGPEAATASMGGWRRARFRHNLTTRALPRRWLHSVTLREDRCIHGAALVGPDPYQAPERALSTISLQLEMPRDFLAAGKRPRRLYGAPRSLNRSRCVQTRQREQALVVTGFP